MHTRPSCSAAQLRLQRSQRLAAWHKPISDIHRLFFQKLRANELSNLIENPKRVHKNYHFFLVRLTSVCPCSGITIRAGFSKNLLYESLVFGKFRGSTDFVKNASFGRRNRLRIDDFDEIPIFVKIVIIRAHPPELFSSPAPATEKPETCRLAQTHL